jgi:ketosteroid isomerase-like protein
MSQENVEVVREFTEAYLRGAFDEALAHLAPKLVYEVGQELPARTPAEVRAMWERWESDWDELETVPEEYIDAGDQVILAVRYSGRGRASGIAVEDRQFEVHTLSEGKIVRKVEFSDRFQALEAAGIPEQN